jgi:hypothetical protein
MTYKTKHSRRTGDGGERRLTGAETAVQRDSGATRRRRDVTAMGERRARRHDGGMGDGVVGEEVGAMAACMRRPARVRGASVRRSGGRREARSGGGRCKRGRLSEHAARCPDSGFKPRHRRGTWQPRGNGALPRGV